MSKQSIITMIEFGRDGLIRAVEAAPEDKLNWKPLDNGRSILDLLCECAQTPDFLLQVLREGTLDVTSEDFQRMTAERAGWTREYSIQLLRGKTEEAIAAIRDFPEDRLDETIELSIFRGASFTTGACMLMLFRTFAARTAQINYIQTLYGDFEFH